MSSYLAKIDSRLDENGKNSALRKKMAEKAVQNLQKLWEVMIPYERYTLIHNIVDEIKAVSEMLKAIHAQEDKCAPEKSRAYCRKTAIHEVGIGSNVYGICSSNACQHGLRHIFTTKQKTRQDLSC